MLNVEQNNQDNDNQKPVPRKKQKVRAFRLWEMTSDPKSFLLFLFLGLFFFTTSFICISDVMQQRSEHRMEVSRLHSDSGVNDNGKKRKKKKNRPLTKEEKKRNKIFNTSLRQAIRKEKKL